MSNLGRSNRTNHEQLSAVANEYAARHLYSIDASLRIMYSQLSRSNPEFVAPKPHIAVAQNIAKQVVVEAQPTIPVNTVVPPTFKAPIMEQVSKQPEQPFVVTNSPVSVAQELVANAYEHAPGAQTMDINRYGQV